MNNKELKALRQILALECSEAAEHIGEVTTRTWQRWEDGSRAIPGDVAEKIADFAKLRDSLVERRFKEFKDKGDFITLSFYMTVDEFEEVTGKRNVVMWKITNSVAGECLSAGIAKLI
ncbi:Aca2/YdiL-like domain-containing protein [Serratia marcescens]|jgi:hypothetical protein|uniref:Aca2/YdiL-like domain-containing protein n=1 Tax=Serratia marcescens TaxID=615 RepID=UPI00280B0068|nr:DUF1870 family protein [Serratia marcescens]